MQEISDYMSKALETVSLPKRPRRAIASPPAPFCLPPGCQGGGHQIRARMEVLAAQCKNDEICLKSGLGKIWTEIKAGKMPWSAGDAAG